MIYTYVSFKADSFGKGQSMGLSERIDAAVENAIATGQKKYPIAEAAPVIVGAVVEWLQENPDTLTEVRLVGFSKQQTDHFVAAVNDRLSA